MFWPKVSARLLKKRKYLRAHTNVLSSWWWNGIFKNYFHISCKIKCTCTCISTCILTGIHSWLVQYLKLNNLSISQLHVSYIINSCKYTYHLPLFPLLIIQTRSPVYKSRTLILWNKITNEKNLEIKEILSKEMHKR